MAMNWLVRDRDYPNIGFIAIDATKWVGFVKINIRLDILKSLYPISFVVEIRFLGTAMDWVKLRLGNIGNPSSINLCKVDGSVHNFWCWACRGADFVRFWILYEEITYNRMSPH